MDVQQLESLDSRFEPQTGIDREWQEVRKFLNSNPIRYREMLEDVLSPEEVKPYKLGDRVMSRTKVGGDSSLFQKFSGRGWKIHICFKDTFEFEYNKKADEGGKDYVIGNNEARVLNWLSSRGLYAKVELGRFTYIGREGNSGSTIYVGSILESILIARLIERDLGDILVPTGQIEFPPKFGREAISTGSGNDRYLVNSGLVVGRFEANKLLGYSYDFDYDAVMIHDVAFLVDPREDARYLGLSLHPDLQKSYQELIKSWNGALKKGIKKNSEEFSEFKSELNRLLRKNIRLENERVNRAFVEDGISNGGCGPFYVSIPNMD